MNKRKEKKKARRFIEKVINENGNKLSKKEKKLLCNAWARMCADQTYSLPHGISFQSIMD